jgi:hypothetical protein
MIYSDKINQIKSNQALDLIRPTWCNIQENGSLQIDMEFGGMMSNKKELKKPNPLPPHPS